MQLKRFRVTTFRSVEDSGWIETDGVTALIGVNESGKTNLLLPLWKLNPAREGEIRPTSDYPKMRYGEVRDAPGDFAFVEAEFEAAALAAKLAPRVGVDACSLDIVRVSRHFDGGYVVAFPKVQMARQVDRTKIAEILSKAAFDIDGLSPLAKEEGIKGKLIDALSNALKPFGGDHLTAAELTSLGDNLKNCLTNQPPKSSTIAPRFNQAIEQVEEAAGALLRPSPEDVEGVFDDVISSLPKFLYYSNYGNLDSEIYLPHVVQNLERQDLGAKEAAKARTLRVLFKFVRLQPREILELGRDFKDPANPTREPTAAEVEAISEKKRERSILLQSAHATLTSRFKEWWKQGDYRFRFEADGDHFRMGVRRSAPGGGRAGKPQYRVAVVP